MNSVTVIRSPGRKLQIIQEGWRPVSNRRARKLRKRNEDVRWFPELSGFAWLPGGQRSRV